MRNILDVAKDLADAHRQQDPGITTIKFFMTQQPEILLLEVSTVAPSTGEILPVAFMADPANKIDYPSVVILLSPNEWQEVQAGRLVLPTGWDLTTAQDL